MMDVIKMEPDIDPLATQKSDDIDIGEEKPLSEKGNLLHPKVIRIKTEFKDSSYDTKSEMTFDETPVPIDFPIVKTEANHCFPSASRWRRAIASIWVQSYLLRSWQCGDLVGTVMMDVVKAELEVDPLSPETSDDTDEDEKKPVLEQAWNLVDQPVTGMKEEYVDQSHDLTSEIKFEEVLVPISFPVVKREPEEEQSDFCEEPGVEVTAEDNEVFAERTVATNERTVSSEFDNPALEENWTLCEIPKNSVCPGKRVRIHDDDKQLEIELPKICFSNSAKLKEKPFKCEFYSKCFWDSRSLRKHDRVHRGQKPFKCDVCGKCFSSSSNLRSHERLHSSEKPFKCDVCGKCFSVSGDLKKHERRHTGEKPFKCDVCGKCFSCSSNLRSHERRHSSEKPFKCDVCGKCFSVSSNQRRHELLHTGEKPFKCDVCGKCFSDSSSQKRHEHRHTGGEHLKCS
ncbi:zinc finger protein 732-like isoform X3 [Periplaneta americana]|uniref:zinc finger protein 732-like isoform X3 n=1 Tax=Periplaneta americana TaxID=6978 RepID=UPI0037E99973